MAHMDMSEVPEKKIRKSRKRAIPKIDQSMNESINESMNEYNNDININNDNMDLMDDQNRAYFESLQKDMEREIERDFQEQLAEIQRREIEEMEEIKRNELAKVQELAKIEKEKNQPSPEELRQRRLKFYENKK